MLFCFCVLAEDVNETQSVFLSRDKKMKKGGKEHIM